MNRLRSIGVVLLLITGLLVALLVSVLGIVAKDALDRRSSAVYLLSAVDNARGMSDVVEDLRYEQRAANIALAMPGPVSEQTESQLSALHARSDLALRTVLVSLQKGPNKAGPEIIRNLQNKQDAYNASFAGVADALRHSGNARPSGLGAGWVMAVANLTKAIEDESGPLQRSISYVDPLMNEVMKINRVASAARRTAGIDRRELGVAIAAGAITTEQLQQFGELSGQIMEPWAIIDRDAEMPSFPPKLRAAVLTADHIYFAGTRVTRGSIIHALTKGGPPPLSLAEWQRQSNPGLDSLSAVSQAAFDIARAYVADELNVAVRRLTVALAVMLLTIGLASLAFVYIIWWIVRPLQMITRSLKVVAEDGFVPDVQFESRRDEIGQFSRALRVFHDSAAQRQELERQLFQKQIAMEAAEISNKTKSRFLANMSHELRTPLNAIIGFSDLMVHRICDPLSPQYDEYAALINKSGHHLLTLVSDILDLAKIEAGKFELDLRTVDISESVRDCLGLIQKQADDRGIKLTADLPEISLTLVADHRACKQILLNLLSNAIKFTRENGQVSVSGRCADGCIKITVRDSGIGIPRGALARIGHAFEQVSNDPALSREGTGLGLALVRALVEKHGGALSINSEEGVGTVVAVELPCSQSASVAA